MDILAEYIITVDTNLGNTLKNIFEGAFGYTNSNVSDSHLGTATNHTEAAKTGIAWSSTGAFIFGLARTVDKLILPK